MGSGTDPEEGTALSVALSEHLVAEGTASILTTHLVAVASAAADEFEMDDAVAALRAYSLVNVERTGLSAHRLVQEVMIDRLGDDGPTWAAASVNLLNAVFPFKEYLAET